MKNWKTTLGGAVGALGVYFAAQHDPSWLPIVGQVLTGLGIFIVGWGAKDRNVTGGTTPQ